MSVSQRSIVKRLEAERGKPMREIMLQEIKLAGSRHAAARALKINPAYFYVLCDKFGIIVQLIAS